MRRLLMILVLAAPGVVTLADASRIPDHVWDTAGISKAKWIATILVAPGIGSAMYWKKIKPVLQTSDQALDLVGG